MEQHCGKWQWQWKWQTHVATHQNTLPHWRQWCLRLNREKADAQWAHSDTSWSGTHSGDMWGSSLVMLARRGPANGDANSCRPYASCVFTLGSSNTLRAPSSLAWLPARARPLPGTAAAAAACD